MKNNIKYRRKLNVCEAQLRLMTKEQLSMITDATFGVTHDWDTKANMLPKLIFKIDQLFFWSSSEPKVLADPFEGLN